MKIAILAGAVALGVIGCATERGGIQTPYHTEYGAASSASAYVDHTQSIFPVWRQPSINGTEAGSERPWIDPSRQGDNYYW